MKKRMSEMANLAARSTALSRWPQGKILALLATGLLAVPTTSSAIVLNFETVGNFNPVGSFYSADGIIFSGDDVALEDAGDSGLFVGEPTPIAAMFLLDPEKNTEYRATVTLDYSAGFTAASFYYATSVEGSVADVYDGIGGTGNVIGTVSLGPNQATTPCSYLLCDWTPTAVSFSGIARSIVFGGANGQIGFDNITLEPANVPLPAAAWLLLSGLAGLGVFGRRRAAA